MNSPKSSMLRMSLTIALGFGLVVLFLSITAVSPKAAPASTMFPAGTTLVPLGTDQSQLRHAYQALFSAVYDDDKPVAWTAIDSVYSATTYAPGTIVSLGGMSGDYDSIATDGTYTVDRAHVLRVFTIIGCAMPIAGMIGMSRPPFVRAVPSVETQSPSYRPQRAAPFRDGSAKPVEL